MRQPGKSIPQVSHPRDYSLRHAHPNPATLLLCSIQGLPRIRPMVGTPRTRCLPLLVYSCRPPCSACSTYFTAHTIPARSLYLSSRWRRGYSKNPLPPTARLDTEPTYYSTARYSTWTPRLSLPSIHRYRDCGHSSQLNPTKSVPILPPVLMRTLRGIPVLLRPQLWSGSRKPVVCHHPCMTHPTH